MNTEPLSALLIRQAERSDTARLVEVYCSSGFFDFAPSCPDRGLLQATVVCYLDLLESTPKSIIFLVAETNAEVAGFSIARVTSRRTWEIQIGVNAAQRKRGIGGALMRRTFTEMRGRGPRDCEAIVNSNNAASIRTVTPFFQSSENYEALPGFVKFRSSW